MTQTLSTLMQREVYCVNADDTIQAIESTLLDRGLSWVPVMDESGSMLGVISNTDLLRFHAAQKDASRLRMADLHVQTHHGAR